MKHVKEIKSLFPISLGEDTIRLIELGDLDIYVDLLQSDYYNEYLDNKFNVLPKHVLMHMMEKVINNTNNNVQDRSQVRLVLVNKDNKILGGMSLFNISSTDNYMEIAYFVDCNEQHKGYCYNMVRSVLNKLNELDIGIRGYKLSIHESNAASLRLASRLGFSESERIVGLQEMNLIMTLDKGK